jgi:hypothetical protein
MLPWISEQQMKNHLSDEYVRSDGVMAEVIQMIRFEHIMKKNNHLHGNDIHEHYNLCAKRYFSKKQN